MKDREIKFRLHCENTGKVLAYEVFNTFLNDGYYWVDANLPYETRPCETCNYFRHPEPLSKPIRVEFTGLRDSNDVEIYEGDIVRTPYYGYGSDPIKYINEVVTREPWGFELSNSMKLKRYRSTPSIKHHSAGFTVIGNIYQNPELLPHAAI